MKSKLWVFLTMLLMNQRGEVENVMGGDDEEEGKDGAGGSDDSKGGDSDSSEDKPELDPLYGDLKVEWPEGMEDSLKKEVSLKPFVDKDGKLRTASLLHAYHQTKKMVGADKVVIPKEDAPDEEKAAFFKKLGWVDDKAAYAVERGEGSKLQEKFVSDLKDFAHENRVPLSVAQKMVGFMEAQAAEGEKMDMQSIELQVNEGLDKIKSEWGQAYEANRYLGRRALAEVVDDHEVTEALKDPRLGSNPAVMKILAAVGKKVFGEDAFKGNTHYSESLSPEQAQEKIAAIYADKNHPYHKGDKAATTMMNKLFAAKRG